MVSDLSTEADRLVNILQEWNPDWSLSRSQRLYIAFALKYVADIIGPQVASASLLHSLWLPILICALCFLVSFPFLAALPETLPDMRSDITSVTMVGSLGTAALRAYRSLLTDWRIAICMAIAFLTQFRYLNASILVPYTSVRFGWSISQVRLNKIRSYSRCADILLQTSRLLSIVPNASLIVFLLLPSLMEILQRRIGITKECNNLIVVRALLSMLVFGGTVLTVAPSIPVLILGMVANLRTHMG